VPSLVAGELLFSPGTEHVALLHSVLGLARIELVIADSKGIGARMVKKLKGVEIA
jgi:hypothetical protein